MSRVSVCVRARAPMLTLAMVANVVAHVPVYTGCRSGCCKPTHKHEISQVFYFRGTGGLELHIESPTDPFDIMGNEVIDVDAVFKQSYDTTTFALFIGCGGCLPNVDPIVESPVNITSYQNGVLEPFTQTSYRSVFKKEDRKYNTSHLVGCDHGHFTIRVIDFANRTDNSELVWGSVIGLRESFTVTELLSFPIFIVKNHGVSWNGAGWTIYAMFPLSIGLWWTLRSALRTFTSASTPSPFDVSMQTRPRAWVYELAIAAFLWSGLEIIVHLLIAQSTAEFGREFFITLFVVVGLGSMVPLVLTVYSFMSMYSNKSILSRPFFIPIEMALSTIYLFLFGAGFFLGPCCVFIASVLRVREAVTPTVPIPLMQRKTQTSEVMPSLML